MPSLQSYLDYNDPLTIIWRTGLPGDEYKQRTDSLPVINNIITLLEIPSETNKVQISGLTEITMDIFNRKKFLDVNEFIVNYSNGAITFHPSQEGKSFVCGYYGKGIILYPASRIYAMITRNPDTVITLQELAEEAYGKIGEMNSKIAEADATITAVNQAKDAANLAADNANVATANANNAAQNAQTAATSTSMIFKEPVNTLPELTTTYPNPENGWRVMVNSTGDIYRYDGLTVHDWQFIENWTGGSLPPVTETLDGILRKEDYQNFIIRTIPFIMPKVIFPGVQNLIIQFPFDGEIVNARGFCIQAGTTAPFEVGVERISQSDFINGGSWDNIFSQNIIFNPESTNGESPIIEDMNVSTGDYFRVNVLQMDNNIRGITVQLDIKTINI